ncbi:MAG: methyltransferase domain-containing protein [Chloroflexi bacterium]|nr:methyltransferase domain-containing protein [Chloroflexota bacterium]
MSEILPPEFFARADESDDSHFYSAPRKLVHIDEGAITAVSEIFAELLPPTGDYLDLMSSWRSHLPAGFRPTRVVGLGMNAAEMADNPQLSEYVVHDLNKQAQMPFAAAEFDAAFCTVSIQYLTRPVQVFREVRRVLKPEAPFIVTFSNRCFPTKAVAIWLSTSDRQHMALVTQYFEAAGGWHHLNACRWQTRPTWFGAGDPLYVVWARKAGDLA